jgi:tRNA threonylcarbamoyladenosine biosynthesis protein TsaB
MPLLALDTTTRVPSAALISRAGVLHACVGVGDRSQAAQLPTLLIDLVAGAGLALADIETFAVAAGPGAFTGLRIGIATMQALALVNRRRLVAVSALDVLAELAAGEAPPGALVAGWMDAHRRDVFAALYRVETGAALSPSRLTEVAPAVVDDPARVLDRWAAARPIVIAGDGAVRYAAAAGFAGRVLAPPPLAPMLARMALDRADRGAAIDPAAVRPVYIRRPDAELARERR